MEIIIGMKKCRNLKIKYWKYFISQILSFMITKGVEKSNKRILTKNIIL